VVAEKQVEYVGGEVKLTNLIMYTFDVDGAIISFNINGEEYFYVRNLQQDIVALIDENGMIVADYLYDAWGNILNRDEVKNNSIARLNPYRYRGYRYDEETGLYYLNSRYYNPEIGRFINADGLIGQTGKTLSHNMYAYTSNNPVMRIDENGYFWHVIAGAAVGSLVSSTTQIITNIVTGQEWHDGLAAAALGGAVEGALLSIGSPGILASIAGNLTEELINTGFTEEALKNTAKSVIIGETIGVATKRLKLDDVSTEFGDTVSKKIGIFKKPYKNNRYLRDKYGNILKNRNLVDREKAALILKNGYEGHINGILENSWKLLIEGF